MRKLFILLICAVWLCLNVSAVAWMTPAMVGGGTPAAGGTWVVYGDLQDATLDDYDATDGNTITTSGDTSFSAAGMYLDSASSDLAYITATDGNNIEYDQGTIEFKYDYDGTGLDQYDRLFQLGTAGGDFRMYYNAGANNEICFYFDDSKRCWDDQDTNWVNLFDQSEHTVRVTWDTTADELKYYADGSQVGSTASLNSDDALAPGGNNLNLCCDDAGWQCEGTMSDFYIWHTVEAP